MGILPREHGATVIWLSSLILALANLDEAPSAIGLAVFVTASVAALVLLAKLTGGSATVIRIERNIILLPILFPLVTGLGFDPVWFGIIMVVWLEIGLITPPVGLNLFVIQNLMRGTTARDVTVGTTPYVVLMIVLVVLLFLFPDLALWLPRQMAPK